jgi:hypothetical protein
MGPAKRIRGCRFRLMRPRLSLVQVRHEFDDRRAVEAFRTFSDFGAFAGLDVLTLRVELTITKNLTPFFDSMSASKLNASAIERV